MPHDISSSMFLVILLFEPLVGFEPTTPRLQITCSGQLSSRGGGGQAIPIAPLQPSALAPFPSWGIQRELVVGDLSVLCLSQISGCKDSDLFLYQQGDVNTISVF